MSRKSTTLIYFAVTTTFLLLRTQSMALPVDLGLAGPTHWALLEIAGAGTTEVDAENVSGAAAPPNGFIQGNVGGANISHIVTSAGNFPILGTVFLGDMSTADAATAGNATGGVVKNAASQALTLQAAIDARNASSAAAALPVSGGGVGVTSITSGGTLTPGVYHLSDLNLPNNAILNLAAGGAYVFDITGTFALHSSRILTAAGLSEADVLFNVTGTQGVATSGGLNNESVIHGIVLAPDASISLTPGLVVGEIIGGENINIASGGSIIAVPEAPTSSLLIFGSVVSLLGLRLWARVKAPVRR
jgi:hypothetical protein